MALLSLKEFTFFFHTTKMHPNKSLRDCYYKTQIIVGLFDIMRIVIAKYHNDFLLIQLTTQRHVEIDLIKKIMKNVDIWIFDV